MDGLTGFPDCVGSDQYPEGNHGNAAPILAELRHALERLVQQGEETRIDLSALPFGPGDEERLSELLGIGEVEAVVSALGPTRVRETAVPGVWLVDYRNADDERLTWHIEIAPMPEILRPHQEDLAAAIATLDARLATTPDVAGQTAYPGSRGEAP